MGLHVSLETPEGGPVGLVKQLALSAYITTQCDVAPIMAMIQPTFTKGGKHIVFHNGAPIGRINDKDSLYTNCNVRDALELYHPMRALP